MHTSMTPMLVALSLVAGCSLPSRVLSGVAVSGDRIYLVGAPGLWAFDSSERRLGERMDLNVPCLDPVDIEHHALALYLLCRDGHIFVSPDVQSEDSLAWRELVGPLEPGWFASGFQRSDATLSRVERAEPTLRWEDNQAMNVRAIVDRGGRLVVGDEWPPIDLWNAGDGHPATSNEAGTAFAFVAKMHRRARISLTGPAGNVHCRTSRWFWPVDAAIDGAGRTLVVAGDDQLAVVWFDAEGSIRARAHAPLTGNARPGRLVCRLD